VNLRDTLDNGVPIGLSIVGGAARSSPGFREEKGVSAPGRDDPLKY
jgi:hypothetical protein